MIPVRKPGCRRDGDIKVHLTVRGLYSTEVGYGTDFENTVMNLWVSYLEGTFSDSYVTISFSERTLIHILSKFLDAAVLSRMRNRFGPVN
jgi:hypothetical protein